MNKNFKFYLSIWAILLAIFNIAVFVSPSELVGLSKFGGAFWAGYIFITLALIGQLVCARVSFKAENLRKLFYNIPLIRISYTGLVLTIIFGAACMAIPNLTNWVGIIACLLILAFNAIAVMKAHVAADIVTEIDEKTKAKTQFVKLAIANTQNIMNNAKSDIAKAECKKVYEALRYCDPMSNDALSVEEAKITVKMEELANAVNSNSDNISEIAKGIVLLVGERNSKCKGLK